MADLYRVGAGIFLALAVATAAAPAHAVEEYAYSSGTRTSAWSTVRGETCAELPGINDPGDYICGPGGVGSRIDSFYWNTTTNRCIRRITNGNGCVLEQDSVDQLHREFTGCVPPLVRNAANTRCISQEALQNAACKALADGLNFVGAPLVHYGAVGLTACFGGYVIKGSGGAGGGGQSELYGPFACSGQNASACAVVPKPSDITAECEKGSFPGTVNGVQVCSPPGTSLGGPTTTTATPPTPGASAPAIPGAPPGTTEQTSQTTCTNGTCKTVTVNKDSTGASTGTTEKTESQASYCAANPKAPGCDKLGSESTFAGNCDGGFTFKGDAIQGAMAKEIHQQNCLLNRPTDESALYDQEKNKSGNQTTDLPGNDLVNVGAASFDQSNALTAGPACIGDKSVTVMGTTVSLPFSGICPWLENLGYVLMAISALLSARIVTRG